MYYPYFRSLETKHLDFVNMIVYMGGPGKRHGWRKGYCLEKDTRVVS